MTPAVINFDLARGTDYDVVLLVQDAAAVPLDLTGAVLDLTLKDGDAAVPLAAEMVDAAGGHVRFRVPGLGLGMYPWECWLQASPDTPRERIIRGLVTVSDKVDPRADGNPSTHRYIVRMSDAVTVSVDSVDLAWWAYEQTRLLLGVDYASLAAQAAATAQRAETAAHTSSVNAAASATEAMRHKDAASLSAAGAATSERNAGTSAQASHSAAQAAKTAQEAAEADAQELRRRMDRFTLAPGTVESLPYGAAPFVRVDQGPDPASHVLNFGLVTGPKGDKGDPGTLAANAGDVDINGRLTATSGTINGQLTVNNPTGNLGNGTHNQIHGVTWFYQQPEFRSGAIIRGNAYLESGVLSISKAASLNCKGPATYDAAINANGGINIPLAVGAATDTAATTRAYALGMALLVLMHQARTYWLASSCTATNGVTINHVVPGCYCEARLAANQHTSLTMRTTGVVGGGNYSKILGYSIPVRNSGDSPGSWFKISLRIGAGGEWTEYPDAGMDDYRFRPVSGSAPSISRLVEVTLYYQDGYKARVRELIGIGTPRSYVVRTTSSSLNYDGNTGISAGAYRLVIAQSSLSYSDALAAGVWLIIGGAAGDTVIKLADIRGWDTYHVSSAPALYLDAQAPSYGGYVQMESPTIINGIGNNTYVRYGLEPYQRSWITNVTEKPYTDEQPTE